MSGMMKRLNVISLVVCVALAVTLGTFKPAADDNGNNPPRSAIVIARA